MGCDGGSDLLPAEESLSAQGFALHGRQACEKQLADVGDSGGVAGREALAGQQGQEPAEDLVDRSRGGEILDRTQEFGGDTFRVFVFGLEHLIPPMVIAERGMVIHPQHGAAAAIGGLVLAAIIYAGIPDMVCLVVESERKPLRQGSRRGVPPGVFCNC